MATAAAVSKPTVHSLPEDILARAFAFIEPEEVLAARKVCKAWKGLISSSDQVVWKDQCTVRKVSMILPELEAVLSNYRTGNVSGVFTTALLELVTAYFGDANYKEFAMSLKGHVTLFDGGGHEEFVFARRSSNRSLPSWGSGRNEDPFLRVEIHWADRLPRGLTKFPSEFPLWLFMKKDGTFKDHGDAIRIKHRGWRIILQCEPINVIFPEVISPLATELALRVEMGCSFWSTRKGSLKHAKAIAKKVAGEWISSD